MNAEALLIELRVDLEYVEDILGFHEGSAKPNHDGGRPVIWINAEGVEGDYQTILRRIRRSLITLEALSTIKGLRHVKA